MAAPWLRILRPVIFIVLAATFLVFDIQASWHLRWVTGYVMILTLVVVGIQLRYRDRNRAKKETAARFEPQTIPGLSLDFQDILLHEFEYAKETAHQAMQDRLTMVNYFLLITGVILAAMGAMLGKQVSESLQFRDEAIFALSLAFNIVGWVYFMQLVRLRQAWGESAENMNYIKAFFARHCSVPFEQAMRAFRWRMETIPAPEKKMTVFHLSAALISVLSSAAVSVATFAFVGLDLADEIIKIALLLGLYHFFFQMSMYTAFLEKNSASKKKSGGEINRSGNNSGRHPQKVEVIDEKLVLDDFFKIIAGRLRFEKYDGSMSEEVRRLSLQRGDAVAVVLYDRAEKKIILVEQFRYPVYKALGNRDGWIIELVAGMVEKGETPEDVVRREVLEEAGCEVEKLDYLGRILPSPGGASERIMLYYAEVARWENAGGGLSDEHEDIRLIARPVREVYDMVRRREIEDAKTLVGLWFARDYFSDELS